MGTTIVAPSGVTNVDTNLTGNPGTNVFSYWVVASLPQGQLQVSPPGVINNAPTVLSGSNYVTVIWNAVAGATSYTCIRTNGSGVFPGSANNCVVEVGSDTTAVDNGGALGNFTYSPIGGGGSGGSGSVGSGALVLLEQHTANASTSLDFTTAISATYDIYQIEMLGIVPVTNSVDLLMRVNTGSGFISSGVYWNVSWRNIYNSQAPAGDTAANATSLLIAMIGDHIPTNTNYGVVGTLKLYTPISRYTTIIGQIGILTAVSSLIEVSELYGIYANTTPITQIQFLMSSGNIASGTIRIYGIAKS